MPHKHNAGANKQKGGIRLFWIPTGSRNKHKKNKYYIPDNYDSPKRAMMSGDSPNSHTKDYFEHKEGRSTPPPTTSKDIAIQSCSGDTKAEVLTASVILEPIKNHEACNNYVSIDGHLNHKNDDEIIATEDKPLKSDHLKEEENKKRMNGTIDKLDGNWVPPSDTKKDEDEADDSCGVKCLYYTLQCCECSIM